jgi:general secretion pathway protein A
MPLSAKETEAYVHHRINIAAQRPLDLFSSRACRLIHRYAKGIPRLINIACDRALLMAYTLGRNKVTPNIVHGALEELTSRGFKTLYNPLTRRLTWAVIFMALAVIVVIILKDLPFNRLREWYSGVPSSNAPLPAPARPAQPASPLVRTYKIPQGSSEEQNRSVSEEISAQGEDRTEPMTTSSAPTNDQQQELSVDSDDKAETQESSAAFIQSIEALEPLKSRIAATETILLLWEQPLPKADHLPLVVNDAAFFDIVARQYGLRLYRMDNNWGLVKKINLPTIVAFRHSSYGRPVYLVLTQWQSDSVTLRESPAHQPITIDFPSMQSRGDGATFIFWKNTLGFDSVITKGANEQAVLSLKKLLRSIGYQHIAADTKFEDATMAAIMDFQARNRLEVDGLVGSLTKILMINQALTTSTPRLDRQRGG